MITFEGIISLIRTLQLSEHPLVRLATGTLPKIESRVIHVCLSRFSSVSGSEMSQSEEDEPVTSTVPELTGEDIPAMLKSDRSSWLYRWSRSRSPKGEEVGKRGRLVTTRQQAPSYKPQSYKPHLVTRKNEVCVCGDVGWNLSMVATTQDPEEERHAQLHRPRCIKAAFL